MDGSANFFLIVMKRKRGLRGPCSSANNFESHQAYSSSIFKMLGNLPHTY